MSRSTSGRSSACRRSRLCLRRPDSSQRDRPVEREVADELAAHVLEHARRERVSLVSRPQISFRTDDALGLGEFGIQARLVRPADDPSEPEEAFAQGDHGHTMVYSTAARVQEPLHAERASRRGRAFVLSEGKRMPVPSAGAVVGRSRECDIVIADQNVSRRHAEIRPVEGGWTLHDLGSTNGVRVNGQPATGAVTIASGDRIELGTVPIGFEVE